MRKVIGIAALLFSSMASANFVQLIRPQMFCNNEQDMMQVDAAIISGNAEAAGDILQAKIDAGTCGLLSRGIIYNRLNRTFITRGQYFVEAVMNGAYIFTIEHDESVKELDQ